jgi:hypothetical protein
MHAVLPVWRADLLAALLLSHPDAALSPQSVASLSVCVCGRAAGRVELHDKNDDVDWSWVARGCVACMWNGPSLLRAR